MALNNIWDERFASEEYVYGTEPNEFFKSEINKLPSGTILLPCEGEGRNAVYAAKSGWSVHAFDSSIEARKKALKLAELNNVKLRYDLLDINDFKPEHKFNAIGLIFCHFEPDYRKKIHTAMIDSLKSGGVIILEAFNKRQINNNTGGPKNIDYLYTSDILIKDFQSLFIEKVEEKKLTLNEGCLHNGESEIVRMLAFKK